MILVLADMPSDARKILRAAGGAIRVVSAARELTAEGGDVEAVIVGCRSWRLGDRVDMSFRGRD